MRRILWRLKGWYLRQIVKEAARMSRSHWNIAVNELEDHINKEPNP